MVWSELFDARDLVPFPKGDNDTDTIFGGVHFNVTVLEHFNYTVYDNGTLSNGSKCWLTYEPYMPAQLLNNGTFINATKCWSAVEPIGSRGYTGIGLAAAFGVSLVLILTALAKHGRQYLPREKRFYPIGRRWQWYWGCFVCACALISLFLNIDVDRYRVQELPIIVTTFFWYLMCMGTLALTWEAVRHWGSWLERQYVDPNPFAFREDDRRAKVEFYLPLGFYFLVWMNFFMIIPRNWNFASKQRSPEQEASIAVPGATSARFKAGAFFLFVAWLTICFSLRHSIKHYKPRNRGIINRTIGLVQAIPLRFLLILPLSLSIVAYQALICFDFQWSVMKAEGPVPIIYGWGYGTQLAILLIQIAYGYASPNEDKELIRQRRVRGEALDRELGLVRKPAWWRRVKGEHLVGSVRDKLLRNVNEVGQGKGTATGRRVEGDMERNIRENMETEARGEDGNAIEMRNYGNKDEHNPRVDRAGVRSMNHQQASISGLPNVDPELVYEAASGVLFPDPQEVQQREREAELERSRRLAFLQGEGPPPPSYYDTEHTPSGARPAPSQRSNSTGTADSIGGPPAQVRSMLDV